VAGAQRTWLVECYSPGVVEAAVADAATRAREAVRAAVARGGRLEYRGALFVAEDEVVFHTFAADDADIVGEVSRSAELRFERIVESIAVQGAVLTGGLSGLLGSLSQTPITSNDDA
jgi:hypothetical protein